MDAFMKFVRADNQPSVIPMPAVYSIPGESKHQQITGLGRQITQFVHGVVVEEFYPQMSHADKLKLICRMALAWQACWDLPIPLPRQIGEIIATDTSDHVDLTIGPDRHFSLGGPFTSVRDWLKARLQHAFRSLERATGIDDFKEDYLASIKASVASHLDRIPQTVEDCPIVAIHVDMGLHNVLVSPDDRSEILAIIDWEFCASAPFLAAYECIEMFFRHGAPNGYGSEYPRADELRASFWNSIPKWKAHMESQGAKDFTEWLRFARFMKPEYCSSKMPKAERMEFWAENIRVVDGMLRKYGAQTS